jgi:hypothetical protein
MDIRCPPHTLQIFGECFTSMNIPYRKEEEFYTYSLRVGGILWLLRLIVVRSSPLLRSRLKNLACPTSHGLCMVRFILTSISCFTGGGHSWRGETWLQPWLYISLFLCPSFYWNATSLGLYPTIVMPQCFHPYIERRGSLIVFC